MKKATFLLSALVLSLIACQSGRHSSLESIVVNVRTALQNENPISLKNDVESIEYIPLETNDSCLISNLLNLQVSDDYLFMYNGKSGQILQFDRKGKFIRQIGREGNGPEEYGMVSELAIDNDIDDGVPFWPEYACADGSRAQVVSAYLLSSLRNRGYLKRAPVALNVGEDSNPVIMIYKFKN